MKPLASVVSIVLSLFLTLEILVPTRISSPPTPNAHRRMQDLCCLGIARLSTEHVHRCDSRWRIAMNSVEVTVKTLLVEHVSSLSIISHQRVSSERTLEPRASPSNSGMNFSMVLYMATLSRSTKTEWQLVVSLTSTI